MKIRLQAGQPAWSTGTDWQPILHATPIQTSLGRVTMGLLKNNQLFDIGYCFDFLLRAERDSSVPLFWNLWEKLPAKPDQIVSIMMGRTLEFCVPVVLSDSERIYEITELANREKFLKRVDIEDPYQAEVDLKYAWGLRNCFKMVTKNLKGRHLCELALRRYASLIE